MRGITMKKRDNKYIILFSLILTVFTGCRDDLELGSSLEVIEGEDATVTLNLTVPELTVYTRAAGVSPGSEAAKTIESGWLGIFRVDGEKIGETTFTSKIKTEHSEYGKIELEVKTISGEAYIVAVGNPKGNYGTLDGNSRKDLLTLLQEVKNWDEYCKIARVLMTPNNIFRNGASNFVMSGSYTLKSYNSPDNGEGNYTPEKVVINPRENKLQGSIHLRRLDSYNLFNITVDPNITLTPVSWSVYNVPGLCYIHEQDNNASDDYFKVGNDFSNYGNVAYHNSEIYESQWFDKKVENQSYSFDFYLLENRHKGIIKDISGIEKPFNLREAEFKIDGDGNVATINAENPDLTNTGWYKSLVNQIGEIPAKPSGEEALRNNNATYVVMRVKMSYYYNSEDNEYKPVPYDPNNPKLVLRTADVKYTVHLGYCKGEGLDKVNDFNCFRNSKYKYTLNIEGVDNVRLEAEKEGEYQPSVEGIVTDKEGAATSLDSHYGVVNIKLTDNERKNLVWMVQTPYGENDVITMIGGNISINVPRSVIDATDDEIKEALPYNQFYNWIQIVPTDAENIITDWGDKRIADNPKANDIMYLEDFCSLPEGTAGSDEEKWYTILIDEYVYNHRYDKNKKSLTGTEEVVNNWGDYINIGERKLWLIIGGENLGNSSISYDAESIYNKAEYLISQESMESYYSPSRTPANSIGIESLNESYIYYDEQVWIWEDYISNNRYSSTDGWANQVNYVGSDSPWSNFLKNTFRKGLRDKENGTSNNDLFNIPDHENKFMDACLSRNRDLNGNGKIDKNEIRWYLPTAATYTRIMLGGPSLRNPLFSPKGLDVNDEKYKNFAGVGAPFTHYAASNRDMLWAEELAATDYFLKDNIPQAGNLRCIRNLGIKPGDNIPSGGIQQAYEKNEVDKIIELTYYRSSALRSYTSNHLGPHSIVDYEANSSRKFKYALMNCELKKDNSPGNLSDEYYQQDESLQMLDNDDTVGTSKFRDGENINEKPWSKSLEVNSVCRFYSEEEGGSDLGTWRVPNITELAIMYFCGNILDAKKTYLSSTYEYFKNEQKNRYFQYMGINEGKNVAANISNAYVRCVKDVETDY